MLRPTALSAFATLAPWALTLALAAPAGSAQLQPPVFLERKCAVQDYVWDIDLGDVNGDGIVDLGTLRDDTYEVHLGIGDGSFLPGITTSLPYSGIWSTTLAEVTGDSQADLLVVDSFNELHLEKGVGDGNFNPFGVYAIYSDGNEAIAVDMNHDDIRDLVIVGGDWFPGGITVWLGVGGGLFDHDFWLPANQYMDAPYTVDAADIDGDGHLDLVARDYVSKLSVVHGYGDGTLGSAAPTSTPHAGAANFADMNLDGAPDIVAGTNTELKILLNTGNGQFAAPLVSPPLKNTYHLPIGDLNCDGWPDVAGNVGGFPWISLGHGDGTLDAPLAVPLDHELYVLRAGDLNGDGSLDLVGILGSEVSALINQRPAWPWELVGTGLAGSLGLPQLHGAGSLQPGHPLALTLSHALPDAPAFLVIGATLLGTSFKGGVLLPDPAIVWPLHTDATGVAALTSIVPAGLPSHLHFYAQAWIPDSGPKGFASTNGVQAILP